MPRDEGGVVGSAEVREQRAEVSRSRTPKSEALILADQILNRLAGYAHRGSRRRTDSYRTDLNWMTDVLMRVEAGERDPLRPTGQ